MIIETKVYLRLKEVKERYGASDNQAIVDAACDDIFGALSELIADKDDHIVATDRLIRAARGKETQKKLRVEDMDSDYLKFSDPVLPVGPIVVQIDVDMPEQQLIDRVERMFARALREAGLPAVDYKV